LVNGYWLLFFGYPLKKGVAPGAPGAPKLLSHVISSFFIYIFHSSFNPALGASGVGGASVFSKKRIILIIT
jgi:membrane associated rhomboid family serine protease